MEIWHTAQPSKYEPTGWLGHYVDHVLRGTEGLLKAVNIGPELPQALVADHEVVPSIQSIDDFRIRTDPQSPQDAQLKEQLIRDLNKAKESSPALQYLSRLLPTTYAARAVQATLTGRHDVTDDLLVLAFMALVTLTVGFRSMRWRED